MTIEHDSDINKETSTSEENITMAEKTEEIVSAEAHTKVEEKGETAVTSSDDTSDSDHQASLNTDNSPTSENESQPLFEQPVILDGKRSRKPTVRLEVSELTPTKKEVTIPQGHGIPLGDIEYINYQISHASTDALSRMRTICFGRRGNKANIRKNLREFKGFEFDRNSDEYHKHFTNLIKFKKDELKSISSILGLAVSGRNTEQVERILNFLMKPTDEGKRIPTRKSGVRSAKKRKSKRPSTNSKESPNTDSESKPETVKESKEPSGTNYLYTPGKTSPNKRPAQDTTNSSNAKRRKRTPAISESKENHDTNTVIEHAKTYDEEIEKIHETVNKLTEQIEASVEPMTNEIQEVM